MVDWLGVWGIGKTAWSAFRPILEDLAKDAVKNAAKSYVGQCFKKVYSVIHRDALTRATGLALKELLELLESELVRDLYTLIQPLTQYTGSIGEEQPMIL